MCFNGSHGSDSRNCTGLNGNARKSNGIPMVTNRRPGINPQDRCCHRSKFDVCKSTLHWAKDCPHKRLQMKVADEK